MSRLVSIKIYEKNGLSSYYLLNLPSNESSKPLDLFANHIEIHAPLTGEGGSVKKYEILDFKEIAPSDCINFRIYKIKEAIGDRIINNVVDCRKGFCNFLDRIVPYSKISMDEDKDIIAQHCNLDYFNKI